MVDGQPLQEGLCPQGGLDETGAGKNFFLVTVRH